jgi:hypothetical protein
MIPFEFEAELWQYTGKGGWYFLSIPTHISLEIRSIFKTQEEGWGRLKTTATIHEVSWETAIWFSSKDNTYLLPVKSEIRKRAQIKVGDIVIVRTSFFLNQ